MTVRLPSTVLQEFTPMATLSPPAPLASAAVVFFGSYGTVSALAAQRGVHRQTLYREAYAAAQAVLGTEHRRQLEDLRGGLADLQARLEQAQRRLATAVLLEEDQQAEFVATAQALGVSLTATHRLLRVVLGAATPSRAALGRHARAAGHRAAAALRVLDACSCGRAQQIAADEIFAGTKPVLMTLDQDSLCWLGGRLADSRDGAQWAQEFRRLPAAVQVTSDRGLGLRKGLKVVNAERTRAGQPTLAEQSDHFHPVRRAYQALGQVRRQAEGALAQAEKRQAAYDAAGRQGTPRTGTQGWQLKQAWQRAEAAFDHWSARERALGRLRTALRLFTPTGALNTPERAEKEVQAALADMAGPGRDKVARGLGPEAFTFLQRTQAQVAALTAAPVEGAAPPRAGGPTAAALVPVALRVEGLQRRPEALAGEEPQARALRGVLLAASLTLTLAGAAGQQAQTLVREVLAGAWRSSSLVEGLNSVLRMHQGRQKRLTQGLLDLKRLYWNMHEFGAGKRKGSSPYGRLGVALPPGSWWELLKRSPEQLQQELSALNPPP
jgi:hypothetical protein